MGLAQINTSQAVTYPVNSPRKKMRSRRIARTRYRTADDTQQIAMAHKEILQFFTDARVEYEVALEVLELTKQDIEERLYSDRVSWEE